MLDLMLNLIGIAYLSIILLLATVELTSKLDSYCWFIHALLIFSYVSVLDRDMLSITKVVLIVALVVMSVVGIKNMRDVQKLELEA